MAAAAYCSSTSTRTPSEGKVAPEKGDRRFKAPEWQESALFDFIKKVNPILDHGKLDQDQKKYILETLEKINTILNVMELQDCPLAPEIDKLIRDREEARKNKDWELADTVRDELAQKGFDIVDTPKGPVWKETKKAEK